MEAYLNMLQSELDIFLGDNIGLRHSVDVLHDEISAFIAIGIMTRAHAPPGIYLAEKEASIFLAETRNHLLKRHSQWLYFARDLRVYTDNTVYMLKPLEQLHWTARQAILDAGEVIAETLGKQNT
jgi:hypothetical protein